MEFLHVPKELMPPSHLTLPNNQSRTTLSKVLHSCLIFGYRWEGGSLKLKNSTFERHHITGQLGSALNSVDGVKAMILRTNF